MGEFLVTWVSGVVMVVIFICRMDFLVFVKRREGAFKNKTCQAENSPGYLLKRLFLL